MSETTTNTSPSCELVLDYVYGELDEAGKRAFEEHLPNCARCQQEVKSFGRVRAAVKRVMPPVEPSASLGGGALHAQLMHAAAQRKPRRGVLLSFPRKIMQHPALSAAAMFAIVGGAVAINWSRGKMAMPAAEQAAEQAKHGEADQQLDAPKPTEVATATPKAEPMPASKSKEQGNAGGLGSVQGVKGGGAMAASAGEEGAVGDKTKIALQTPNGPMTVERPTAHHAAPAPNAAPASTGAVAAAVPKPAKKAAPPRMKSIALDGKLGGKREAFDDSLAANDLAKDRDVAAKAKNEEARADNKPAPGKPDGVAGGVVYGAGGGGRAAERNGNVKSSAPEEISQDAVAEKAPARDEDAAPQRKTSTSSSRGYAAPASPPPTVTMSEPTAMPPPAASTPSSRQGTYRMQTQAAPSQPVGSSVQKPNAGLRSYDVLRKQADEYAKSGRCDEANKIYQEIENAKQYITPTERVYWIRCLTQKGHEQEAQQRLDELKSEKRVTNAQIQDAEKELNQKRRSVDAKKAKKAPADRAPAPAATEVQQQRRAPAEAPPAQASPPDSTNTKVTKPAY